VSCGTVFPQVPPGLTIQTGESVSLTFASPAGVSHWSVTVQWHERGNTSTTSGGVVSYTYTSPLIYRVTAEARGEVPGPNGAMQVCTDQADLGAVTVQAPVVQDRDGDGVPDAVDKCPTQKGYAMFDGCPAKAKDITESILEKTKEDKPKEDKPKDYKPQDTNPGPAHVRLLPGAPYLIDARVQEAPFDLLPGEASRGDVIQFVFSESMDKKTIEGDRIHYILHDEDGTVLTVTCGIDAECLANDNSTGLLKSGQDVGRDQAVGLILGPAIAPQGGTVPGLQWPATVDGILPLPEDRQKERFNIGSSTDLEVNPGRVYR